MAVLERIGLGAPQPPRQAWLRTLIRFVTGAFLTAALVTLLGMPREPAGWAVVACIVVLGETTGQSVAGSLNRLHGSIVGVLAGALVTALLPDLWLPARVALAVLLSLAACRLLRVGAGQRLGLALAGFFVFIPG
ncbi:MAG: FUSC family protein, partial [Chloroflexota bacterium]